MDSTDWIVLLFVWGAYGWRRASIWKARYRSGAPSQAAAPTDPNTWIIKYKEGRNVKELRVVGPTTEEAALLQAVQKHSIRFDRIDSCARA